MADAFYTITPHLQGTTSFSQGVGSLSQTRKNIFQVISWDEALREFVLHLKASRADKTRRYYEVQLLGLIRWAKENDVEFATFGKRHLDRFLSERIALGRKPLTLRHDALCAKVFFAWCVKNDLLERSNLAEYEVRNAPKPVKYMPSDEDMAKLLHAAIDFWNPEKNPGARFQAPARRIFHRDRNYGVIIGLLDTAARIGEILNLKVEDYRASERAITIRESKGREPRFIPVSGDWAKALDAWLKIRNKLMAGQPKDEGWLFITEYGGRMEEGRFLKVLKKMLVWASISNQITLHSLRRYSLNRLAKFNLLAAQQIAGHKETKTTLIYTKLDPDFIREAHASVAVVKNILGSKREERRKRLI
jgi:site-specific recombinase XerD